MPLRLSQVAQCAYSCVYREELQAHAQDLRVPRLYCHGTTWIGDHDGGGPFKVVPYARVPGHLQSLAACVRAVPR